MITRLSHYAIRSTDLEASRRFYTEVLGLRVGHRPPSPFPGLWLYQNEDQSKAAVVHIIGVDAEAAETVEGHWGIGSSKPQDGTGSFDHIALWAEDWPQMRARCIAHRLEFIERIVPELDLCQVFLTDPSGITLELSYRANGDAIGSG